MLMSFNSFDIACPPSVFGLNVKSLLVTTTVSGPRFGKVPALMDKKSLSVTTTVRSPRIAKVSLTLLRKVEKMKKAAG